MISHAIAGRRLTKRLVSAYSAPFLGPDSGFSTGPVSSLTLHSSIVGSERLNLEEQCFYSIHLSSSCIDDDKREKVKFCR